MNLKWSYSEVYQCIVILKFLELNIELQVGKQKLSDIFDALAND